MCNIVLQNLSNFSLHLRPVLTKGATSRKGTKGDMAHWTLQKSIESKWISQGNNYFWTPNRAGQQPWHIYISFESLESEQHESGCNLEMKFSGCNLEMKFSNLFFILWEQVSFGCFVVSNKIDWNEMKLVSFVYFFFFSIDIGSSVAVQVCLLQIPVLVLIDAIYVSNTWVCSEWRA